MYRIEGSPPMIWIVVKIRAICIVIPPLKTLNELKKGSDVAESTILYREAKSG